MKLFFHRFSNLCVSDSMRTTNIAQRNRSEIARGKLCTLLYMLSPVRGKDEQDLSLAKGDKDEIALISLLPRLCVFGTHTETQTHAHTHTYRHGKKLCVQQANVLQGLFIYYHDVLLYLKHLEFLTSSLPPSFCFFVYAMQMESGKYNHLVSATCHSCPGVFV